MNDPKIYLAVDNCFASKRWTKPSEWARMVRDMGLSWVEASADNECDALYTTPEYLKDWLGDVKAACEETGIHVANLYSGHGTYSTLGLAHTDSRIRDHIQNNWVKVMIKNAADLGAGLGFFCHAFSEATLQNPKAYQSAVDDLSARLGQLAQYAAECGTKTIGLEQMYTPHQIPWTIRGTEALIRRIFAESGASLYVTIDTGHQTGQVNFVRPHRQRLKGFLDQVRSGRDMGGLWLGSTAAYAQFRKAAKATDDAEEALLARIESDMGNFPHLFADPEDVDLYTWLARLGRYSPIIHLQQTDGSSSHHLPFTDENNVVGIVEGAQLLESLASSYAADNANDMPPPCDEIYLTIEMFAGTTDTPVEIIQRLWASVAYWRRFVPEDGVPLSKLTDFGPRSR